MGIIDLISRFFIENKDIINIINIATSVILIATLFYLLNRLFPRKMEQNNEEKEEKNEKQISGVEISIFGYKAQLNYIDIFGVFLFLIYFLSSPFVDGYTSAKNNEFYYVVNTNPEMVVLRSYGEALVSAPFDRETRIVERKFIIVEATLEFGLIASYEHLGKLRPAEIPVEDVEENQEEQEPPE